MSLFGESEELKPVRPDAPSCETTEDDKMLQLQEEKELVGMYLSSHPLDKYRFELDNFTSCKVGSLADEISTCEARNESKKIAIAGLVSSYKPMVTKTGKNWSRSVIEDFNGSYELALFGEDHERCMRYLTPHSAIYIEGEIAPKYRLKPEEIKAGKRAPFGLKVSKISLLGNVTDSVLKAFVITLSSTMLNPKFRSALVKVISKNKGKTPLKVFLIDPATKYKIEFDSHKFGVSVTTDLIADLNEIGVGYQVLRK